MSKSYLLLIIVLVVAILAIGGFAFYRSTTVQTPPSASPTTPTVPSQPPATTTPPAAPLQKMISLTVSSPTNGQIVSTPTVTVSGKTIPNADVAVNDKDLKANASGNFTTVLTLDEGDNNISVTASDENGSYSEWNGTVTYTPL